MVDAPGRWTSSEGPPIAPARAREQLAFRHAMEARWGRGWCHFFADALLAQGVPTGLAWPLGAAGFDSVTAIRRAPYHRLAAVYMLGPRRLRRLFDWLAAAPPASGAPGPDWLQEE